RLRAIIASALDGVLVLDDLGRIILFNPAAEEIFGLASSEALRRPINQLIPDWNAGLCGELGDAEPEAGPRSWRVAVLECEGRRADGRIVPLEASITHIEVRGRSYRTLFVRDITARR